MPEPTALGEPSTLLAQQSRALFAQQVEKAVSHYDTVLKVRQRDLRDRIELSEDSRKNELRRFSFDAGVIRQLIEQLCELLGASDVETRSVTEWSKQLKGTAKKLSALIRALDRLVDQRTLSVNRFRQACDKTDTVFERCRDVFQELGEQAKKETRSASTRIASESRQFATPESSVGVSLRILHFTDLHIGPRSRWAVWPNVFAKLRSDLDLLEDELGKEWDIVLFTGDVAHSGESEQYRMFDRLREELWRRWGNHKPVLLAVPGNHDVSRGQIPARRKVSNDVRNWCSDRKVLDDLWENRERSKYYKLVVKPAFQEYRRWWNRQMKIIEAEHAESCEVHTGLLPGDFSATFQKEGPDGRRLKVGILGLNSAFLHLWSGRLKGRLMVDSMQFNQACEGGDGPKWAERHQLCLLMTHHPPSWFRRAERADFYADIFDPRRFAVHLCGHLHSSMTTRNADHATRERHTHVGSALFARKGVSSGRHDRIHGYAAMRFDVVNAHAEMRLWSRLARKEFSWDFITDPALCAVDSVGSTRSFDISDALHKPGRS